MEPMMMMKYLHDGFCVWEIDLARHNNSVLGRAYRTMPVQFSNLSGVLGPMIYGLSRYDSLIIKI